MGKEIQIQTTKIDWLDLIKLALDKKCWGKKYTIHRYGEILINVEMSSFDFLQNRANFRVSCVYPEDNYSYSWDEWTTVTYVMENYTPEFFEQYILKQIASLLKTIIHGRTRRKATKIYRDIYSNPYSIGDKEIVEAGFKKDLEVIEGIEIDDVRETAYDSLRDEVAAIKNKEYNLKVGEYIEENQECPANMKKLFAEVNELIEKKNE